MGKIPIYKHDVFELLNNEYHVYNNDGGLELSIENIIISDNDKKLVKKSKKTKTAIGYLIKESNTYKFVLA